MATSAATGRLHLSSQWLITMPESIIKDPVEVIEVDSNEVKDKHCCERSYNVDRL